MKKNNSLNNLMKLKETNLEALSVFVKNTRSFQILLNTSKGRDKFC
jgi:hypothetical protein